MPRHPPAPKTHAKDTERGCLPNFTCLSHQPLGGHQRGTQPVAVGLLPGHALPGRVAAQAPGRELNPLARAPAHPSPPPAPHFGRRFGPEVSVPSPRRGVDDMQMGGETSARLRSSLHKNTPFRWTVGFGRRGDDRFGFGGEMVTPQELCCQREFEGSSRTGLRGFLGIIDKTATVTPTGVKHRIGEIPNLPAEPLPTPGGESSSAAFRQNRRHASAPTSWAFAYTPRKHAHASSLLVSLPFLGGFFT